MKVVALISGGKDSCMNMVLCQRFGHEIVALGNLMPAQTEVDDLDSYMYQTVGHQVVSAYAQCMALPLFRRQISGASKDQRLVYEDTAGDEVEDLVALLAYVKQRMPEVQAVSSGAIASDYQRTRVERVCTRLGLVSLAYLWHQPQDALLQSMIDAEVHAVLVKVAAAGLHPGAHLGASLAQMQHHLRSLRTKFGCNVCGEGGEYETLTLDCPLFTRGKIVLDAWEALVVSEDSLAPVALLHPTEFHVEPRAPQDAALPSNEDVIAVPEGIEVAEEAAGPSDVGNSAFEELRASSVVLRARNARGGSQRSCLSLAAEVRAPMDRIATAEGTAGALAAALQRVSNELTARGLSWHDALFVHLYVPAMAHFAAANAAYSRFLPAVNPPARATVQLAPSAGPALVAEVLLCASAAAADTEAGKKVLHVQSISEWAPSCIGPYSQAVAHRGLVFFAGQIPLDPATMAILEPSASDPAVAATRCLSSCQAVAVAMRTDLRHASLWWTVFSSAAAGQAGAAAAGAALEAFLSGGTGGSGEPGDDDQTSSVLDDYLMPPELPPRRWAPLVTFIEVPELPKGALVEMQPVAWSQHGAPPLYSSSSDSSSGRSGDEAELPRRTRLPRWGTAFSVATAAFEAASGAGRGEVQMLCAAGQLFRGTAFAVARRPQEQEQAEELGRAAAEAVASGLHTAGLAAADAASVKLYVAGALAGASGALEATRVAIERVLLGGQSSTTASPVTVVPVLRVGAAARGAAAEEADFALELFATRVGVELD